jgi:hypothetical protein
VALGCVNLVPRVVDLTCGCLRSVLDLDFCALGCVHMWILQFLRA